MSGWLSGQRVRLAHDRSWVRVPGHTKDHHKNGTDCIPAEACMH